MTSIKLLLNKHRMLKDGTFPLVFQVIHNRRKRIFYTKYRIAQQNFDEVTEEVKFSESSLLSTEKVKTINRDLKREHVRLQKRVKMLEKSQNFYSVDDLVESEKAQKSTHFFLLQYAALLMERKRGENREGMAAAYHSTYISLEKYIVRSLKRKKDIRISEVNYCFIIGYESFLYTEGVTCNTVNYYLRNLRTIYNAAIREGCRIQGEYPFSCIHTKPCKTIKRALDKGNMRQLFSLSLLDTPHLEFSRDLYLFSFYAQGMAFVDIVFLKKDDIHNGLLVYTRHKSKQMIQIVVTPQMQALMDKYAKKSEYIFPVIDVAIKRSDYSQYRLALGRINRHLKIIAAKLDIDVPLTTYTARHTWATLARNSGAPISVISAGLGHTSEEMTRIYLKDFELSILARVNSDVTNLFEVKK